MISKQKQALRTVNASNRLMFHACQTAARSGRQQIARANRERADRRWQEIQTRDFPAKKMRDELKGRK